MRVVKSTPEEQHADQDEGRGNRIPDKVHPMDALTATKTDVFVLDIKTIPPLFHLTNQPRQKLRELSSIGPITAHCDSMQNASAYGSDSTSAGKSTK